MSKAGTKRLIIPDEATPRFYGRLTIVICAALLFLGVYTASTYILATSIEPVMGWTQSWTERIFEEELKNRLDTMTQDQVDAKTPEEQARATKQINDLLSRPKPPIASMTTGFETLKNPVAKFVGLADAISALILNIALIVGAAGMIGLREWGRKTVAIVAALKIVRVLISSVAMIGLVLPIQVREMKAQMAPMMNAGPKNAVAMTGTAEFLAAMTTASVVMYSLFALVYPILLLVKVTRARVKAACRAASYKSDQP